MRGGEEETGESWMWRSRASEGLSIKVKLLADVGAGHKLVDSRNDIISHKLHVL